MQAISTAGVSRQMANGLEGVDRALRVLTLLGQRGDGWTLDELASETRLPKSSLHRLLMALKMRGFAVQPAPSGPYLLGPSALEVAFGFHEKLDVPIMMAPLLQELVDRYNETIHLAVLSGGDVVYIDKREGTHPFRMSSTIGGRNPAYRTGVGKALLAHTLVDRSAVNQYVEKYGPLVRQTPATATTATALNAELELTRSRGFALDLEENEPGVHCAAIAVTLGTGRPVAAVSVTAPTMRISRDQLDEIGLDLLRASQHLVPAGIAKEDNEEIR
jgi:IclR family acetate operon transcriptional repressor